jgi:S-adenosylmethionine:tRNA ribosyltransferase-isomerase
MHFSDLKIDDFDYPLPDERIAKYPLENRDQSKLLSYTNGEIGRHTFTEILGLLKPGTQIVMNNTKVVQARLLFYKSEGTAPIEIFCLEPVGLEVQQAMAVKNEIVFYCLVGRAKKWKSDALEIALNTHQLKAEKLEKRGQGFEIKFSWSSDLTFAEILEEAGHTPLPPYLNRKDEESDKERYQTVYAKKNGSVAAPTAGLHFTEEILGRLKKNNHEIVNATLHVGAGTFKPVSSEVVSDHEMHFEEIHISSDFISKLLAHIGSRTAIGTTSVRTLESLYWLGVKLISSETEDDTLELGQWDAYNLPQDISVKKSLTRLHEHMKSKDLFTRTQLMIGPGYQFRMIDTIVTNFHQPKSTLLLLVAAATQGNWRALYDFALANNFRFLSYGDSSIIHI